MDIEGRLCQAEWTVGAVTLRWEQTWLVLSGGVEWVRGTGSESKGNAMCTCPCVCVVLVGLGMHYSLFHLIQWNMIHYNLILLLKMLSAVARFWIIRDARIRNSIIEGGWVWIIWVIRIHPVSLIQRPSLPQRTSLLYPYLKPIEK